METKPPLTMRDWLLQENSDIRAALVRLSDQVRDLVAKVRDLDVMNQPAPEKDLRIDPDRTPHCLAAPTAPSPAEPVAEKPPRLRRQKTSYTKALQSTQDEFLRLRGERRHTNTNSRELVRMMIPAYGSEQTIRMRLRKCGIVIPRTPPVPLDDDTIKLIGMEADRISATTPLMSPYRMSLMIIKNLNLPYSYSMVTAILEGKKAGKDGAS
jgi:hypothetical protein